MPVQKPKQCGMEGCVMSEEALAIGATLTISGIGLNVASPFLNPILNQNLGLWGAFLIVIGLIVIGVRLRSML